MIGPHRRARVIALASGKGGLGATTLAVNAGVELARLGRRTLLADLDFGLGGAALQLGINAAVDLESLLAGGAPISSVVLTCPGGLDLIPSGAAGDLPRAPATLLRRLAEAMRPMAHQYDTLLIDIGTGIDPGRLAMAANCDLAVVMLGEEPTAFVNAFALTRWLAALPDPPPLAYVATGVETAEAAAALFQRFATACLPFLSVQPRLLGWVPPDRHVGEAVAMRRPCVQLFPATPAALAYRRIAEGLAAPVVAAAPGGDRFLALESLHAA